MSARGFWSGVILVGLCLWGSPATHGADSYVNVHTVEGIINPVVVEYMIECIHKAENENAAAVIFQLDTPGGLVESTRLIVKALLGAQVPVVVYVAPSGVRGIGISNALFKPRAAADQPVMSAACRVPRARGKTPGARG
jgi:membrane-bound serine protease (ClpP class)